MSELLGVMMGTALLCFVISEFTGNYSQVDKLWSLMPVAYAWLATIQAGLPPRMLLMAVLISLWGARLTFNFARQGGYSWKPWEGHEDYRWAHVRANPWLAGRWRFMLFNLGFISLFQHALLLLITLPIVAAGSSGRPLGLADLLLTLLFIGLLLMEAIADNQQWAFQRGKRNPQAAAPQLRPELARGFLSSGLWARCRHPNYFAEQALWVLVYGFSLVATGGLHWSGIGCLLLIALFQGSSRLSEGISAAKYPDYARYQEQLPRFLPRLSGRRLVWE